MSLSFRFLLSVSLNRRRGRPLFMWPQYRLEYITCLGSLSCDILIGCPVHRRFFLIRRSSIEGTHIRSSMSLFVTLSIQVINIIERRCRIMKTCSLFTCRMYIVQTSAPYTSIAQYILLLTRMDIRWLFQNIWRIRPKGAVALAPLLCMSSSMNPLLDIELSRKVNSRIKCISLFSSTMVPSYRVLVGLGWYSTSVLLMLIFRANFLDASEKASTTFCISSAECATTALSSAISSSLISIRVVLFSLWSVRRWIGRRSVWIVCRRHPPFLVNPHRALLIGRLRRTWGLFLTLNDSKTYSLTLTFAGIPVCSASMIVMNFSGQPYFLSCCHCPCIERLTEIDNYHVQWLVLLKAHFM